MIPSYIKVGMTVYLTGLPSRAHIPGKVIKKEKVNFGLWTIITVRWKDKTVSQHVANELRSGLPTSKHKRRPYY